MMMTNTDDLMKKDISLESGDQVPLTGQKHHFQTLVHLFSIQQQRSQQATSHRFVDICENQFRLRPAQFSCVLVAMMTAIIIFVLLLHFLISAETVSTAQPFNKSVHRSIASRPKQTVASWHPSFNTFDAILQTYAVTFNVSNCWVCAAIPTPPDGLLFKIVPLNISESRHVLLNETGGIVTMTNKTVSLSLLHSQRGVLCFQQNGTKNVGYSNCNFTIMNVCKVLNVTASLRYEGNATRRKLDELLYDFTHWQNCPQPYNLKNGTLFKQVWTFVNGSETEKKAISKMLGFNIFFQPVLNINNNIKTTLVEGCYFICGKKAYKWLPENWGGSCFIGYVVPAIRHTTYLPNGKIRNAQEAQTVKNPVGKINVSWIYHHDLEKSALKGLSHMDLGDDVISGAGVLPAYGALKAIWELQKLSKLLEVLSNASFEAVNLITVEMSAMRAVVLQNRIALDFVLSSKGDTCLLVHKECCTFIPDNTHAIRSHLEIIQKVSKLSDTEQADTSQWAWLTNLFSGWGDGILKFIMLIAIIIMALVLLYFYVKL
ncbi:junctional sarcoplasmic reticulum protein 1 isoform X1 [Protopterus annectens]|uniref:junctional sarcoplasmic reticulum protein 1 isoform X1 n=1 Tax=Protopterus annectens TaxID=7888 RepID=UPI001CFADEF9|nr:junctional sarcoplasmic reticulum protein 1 isoform X1 [Protopterus annectens]XP_043946706.1 junctional sarcoplasmic reticulum protein 1 isoform X1 [Protopterus annectens]